MSEVYIEMQRNGAYLRVTAIDPSTGEEVFAVGPANDPESVKRLALLKLRNKLTGTKLTPPGKPGISV